LIHSNHTVQSLQPSFTLALITTTLYFSTTYKGKNVVPVLRIKHYAMKTYGGGVDVQIHTFLTSVLVGGGQLHASAALPPGIQPPCPLEKRLGGPQSRSDDVGKRKFFTLTGLELRPLVVQPLANRYTYCAIRLPF
jgi:hypothetical protein